ncbi:MAG: UvrD-helicase domain-containing protein, partial [Candidatus Thiosymbion ectosymbiont of Robbea hypermnestra]|nr:UvrD-helicase domain-containing protein [Candidatus Thiosymbion ectosymbiont of Robbea hypermnestra]
MTTLDPLRIPLRGLTLIEASAGTGKTYSIATLYLRLLLEWGLEVDRILVVTFTEAATEELRERIRKRLRDARDWLQGDIPACREQDPILADLLLAVPDPDEASALVADALARMDEAAIHTIHGFCLRTLRDNAFESGAAFDVEFITDEGRLRHTAAADFWRLQVAAAAPEYAAWVRERWVSPEALLADLEPTLGIEDLRLLPEVDQTTIAEARRELAHVFAQLQDLWRTQGEEVQDILSSSPALNRRSYNKRVVAAAIAAAQALSVATEVPDEIPIKDLERLTPTCLTQWTKDGRSPPVHPFFALCGRS